jgi:hypothetical protein
VSSDRKQAHGGLSVSTLTIASASSLVAALVVSKVWGAGTLFGAALTPVIVAVVSEGLRRPATVVATVRQTRATPVYDPVAEGRRGLAEGDLSRARPAAPGATPERRVHRAGPTVPAAVVASNRSASARSKRRLLLAVATGLAAFVVAGVVLTGSELVLGNSVVSSAKRTTYIPVKKDRKSDTEKTTKTDTDAKTTTDTTTTETTTQPSETTPTTTTAPDAQTPQPNSVPAPAPKQTAPAPTPAPSPQVPAPTTSTPAQTP